jgi:hypothetical protein
MISLNMVMLDIFASAPAVASARRRSGIGRSETKRRANCNHPGVWPEASVLVQDTAAWGGCVLQLRLGPSTRLPSGSGKLLDHGFSAPMPGSGSGYAGPPAGRLAAMNLGQSDAVVYEIRRGLAPEKLGYPPMNLAISENKPGCEPDYEWNGELGQHVKTASTNSRLSAALPPT